jgi:hypothetical protein
MLRSREKEEIVEYLEGLQTAKQKLIFEKESSSAVNGATLLNELRSFVCRYVVLSECQATVIALWVLHTHLMDSFDVTPYLDINSAEKQSGKTRLLEVLKVMVANGG